MTPEQHDLVEEAAALLADAHPLAWPAVLAGLTPRYLAELTTAFPEMDEPTLKENGRLFLAAVTRRLRELKQGKPQ